MSPVRQRILVVDDNNVLRTLVSQALECAGYEVFTADCGETALEAARLAPPDLFVIDQVMPGMSGAELIRKLRASTDIRLSRCPAIGVTARAGAEEELLRAGAVCALRKPLSEGPLLEGVRRALH